MLHTMISETPSPARNTQPAILMIPPDDNAAGRSFSEREFLGGMPNMGIMYLGAVLEARGYSVVTRDYQFFSLTPFQVAGEIAGLNPILVGFTMFENNVQYTRALVSVLRLAYSGPIVVGGYTATFHAEDILAEMPAVNFVVLREGEDAIVALMEHIEGVRSLESVPNLVYREAGEIRKTAPAPLSDVSKLPWARRQWDEPHDVTPIISRRGCYSRCSFCSMVPFYDSSLGPRVRHRETGDVVDEIENCIEHGRREFMFYDDNFGLSARVDQEWSRRFIQEITRRRLRFHWGIELRVTDVIRGASLLRELCDVGLSHIAIGMETMLPRQLVLYNKGYGQKDIFEAVAIAKSLPLDYQTNILFWDPWLTLEEAAEHISLLEQIGIQEQLVGANYPAFAGALLPRRGTALHNMLAAAGLLIQSPIFCRYSFEFVHPRTATFYCQAFLRLFARSRVTPRPEALWLRVMKLEHEGQRSRAQVLRKYGSAVAHIEFAYFKTMLNTLREIADPADGQRAEQEIHEFYGPQIDSCAELLSGTEYVPCTGSECSHARPEPECEVAGL